MRTVPLIGLIIATMGFMPGASAEEWPRCDEAPKLEPTRSADPSQLRISVEHQGLPVAFVLCVLDEEGNRVARSAGHASGSAVLSLATELPPGTYRALVEATSPSGSGATMHKVDLGACDGTTLTTTQVHRLLGFAIVGGPVACSTPDRHPVGESSL